MAYTFDGPNRLIILAPGSRELDVRDLYSRWKDWAATGDNSKYPPFFSVVGGDPTTGANTITPYFFLQNGARIRPAEENHTLTVNGIVLVDGGGDPFADTLGVYRVRIVQVTPMQAETIYVTSDGSSAGGSSPSAAQVADAVWSHAFVQKLLTVGKFLGLR